MPIQGCKLRKVQMEAGLHGTPVLKYYTLQNNMKKIVYTHCMTFYSNILSHMAYKKKRQIHSVSVVSQNENGPIFCIVRPELLFLSLQITIFLNENLDP